jgi:hypothetical protein
MSFQICDPGYVPAGPTENTCKFGLKPYEPNKGMDTHYWTTVVEGFQCVKPIALVIGGISQDHK